MKLKTMGAAGVAAVILLTGCGGDDSTATSDTDATDAVTITTDPVTSDPSGTAGTGTTTSVAVTSSTAAVTSTTAAVTSTGGTLGNLPNGCGLIDDATVAAAMGGPGTKSKDLPTPTPIATRCEWKSGIYSVSLLVRQGPTAKSDFGNATPDFVPATIPGAQAQVRLGVNETSRSYRLVTLLAYDGRYYVSIILQGPGREDAPATEAAASLVRAALANLPV